MMGGFGGKREQSRVLRKEKDGDESAARRASVKLEDGDIKGAMRLLSSSETLAPPTKETFDSLAILHPPRPGDRRPAPLPLGTAIQVSPPDVRSAIFKFPCGSAGGPDGLRPQHLKDLLGDAGMPRCWGMQHQTHYNDDPDKS